MSGTQQGGQEGVTERLHASDRKGISQAGVHIWKNQGSNFSLKRPRRVRTLIFADEQGNFELTRNSFSSDESQQRSHSSSTSSKEDFIHTQEKSDLGADVHKISSRKARRKTVKKPALRKVDDQQNERRVVKQQHQLDTTPFGADALNTAGTAIQKRRHEHSIEQKLRISNTTSPDEQTEVPSLHDRTREERTFCSFEIDNSETFEADSHDRNDATAETATMTDEHSRLSLGSYLKNVSESSEQTDVYWMASDVLFKNVSKSYADDVSSEADSSSDEIKDVSFLLRYDATNSLLQSTSEAESNLSPRRIQFQYSGEDDSQLLGPDTLTHESQSEESLNPRQDFDYSLAAELEGTAPDDLSEHSRRNSSMVVQACGALSRCVSTLPCCSKNTEWQIDSVPKMPLSSDRPDPPANLSSAQSIRASESPSGNSSHDEENVGTLFDTDKSLLRIVGHLHEVNVDATHYSSADVVVDNVSSATKAGSDTLSPGRSRLKLIPFSKSKKKGSQSDEKLKEYFQWVLLDLQRSSKAFSKGQKYSLRRTYSEPSFEETGNFPATVRDVRRPSLGNENTCSTRPAFDPKLKTLLSGDYSENVTTIESKIGTSKGKEPLSPILNVTSSPERISLSEMQRSTREPLQLSDEDSSYQEALSKWKQTIASKLDKAPGAMLFPLEETRNWAKDSLSGKVQQQFPKNEELFGELPVEQFEKLSGETSLTSVFTKLIHSSGIFLILLFGIRLCSYQQSATVHLIRGRCFTPQWIQLEAGLQCDITSEVPGKKTSLQFSNFLVKTTGNQPNGASACYTPQWVQLEVGVQCNVVAESTAETKIAQLPKKYGELLVLNRGSDSQVMKSKGRGTSGNSESARPVTYVGIDDHHSPANIPSRLLAQRLNGGKQKLTLWRRKFVDWLKRKENFLAIEGDLKTPAFLQL